ncbi:methyltransferase-like protein 27 [Pecten maximus]|uniref:methyltransferase-like protein 27 n=1 Tax=Pecten maximus TaxID=6579 RepID=UPI001458A995|nr:methyltransferase-like protein 27 [Pecten maximus]
MESTGMECPFPAMWSVDTPDQLTDLYEEWGPSYDTDVNRINYKAPLLVSNALAALYPRERQSLKILDVGAGTGLVGVELQKLGFGDVDGLDPSELMLKEARATNTYNNLYCEYFTSKPTPGLDQDSYDVIISAGSLIAGHLPTDCFIEAVRLVRKGGIICIITRTEGKGSFNEAGYGDKCKVVLKQLQDEGELEEIQWEKVNYYASNAGVIMTYRVL